MSRRKVELLAPAKNLACGLAAVDHGADAVYIGAPRFGARAAAVNSLDDIAALVQYAHRFGVRVYVTLNTILRDDELPEAERMAWSLYRLGVDALIVQDMGLTRLHLPPIPLHASTQMDNRTPDKVSFLAEAGFRQVVLARELSLAQIRAIHEAAPHTPLEVFVHGALCVSYSGRCYASQACFGRSANRGECAQFCRLPFTLVDADHRVVVRDKHLLSLRDMNRLGNLEELLDAGVTSLKIEGRLKEVGYVKNVTAAYRQALDRLFLRRTEYVRAASGTCRFSFTPCLEKSFSRGFTSYYLHGREQEGEVASIDTPKSLGEPMGCVKEVRRDHFTVAGGKSFHNGDGLCYLDARGQLQGLRVNRVEGERLYPAGPMPRFAPRTPLFRNFDQEFERQLLRSSATRRMKLTWRLWDTPSGFALQAQDEEGHRAVRCVEAPHEEARTPQEDTLRTQLAKLGGTPFEVDGNAPSGGVEICFRRHWFIPSSQLAEWRRQVVERLEAVRRITYPQEVAVWRPTAHPYVETRLTYLGNVMNAEAFRFYRQHGVQQADAAYEQAPVRGALLMTCRHCLRYMLGGCPSRQGRRLPFREPYTLVSADGRRFRLAFDCARCEMNVIDEPQNSPRP